MNDAELDRMLDVVRRRALTEEEESRLRQYLAESPAAVSMWTDESALTHLLNGLPPAPLASNFSARVLNAVDRLERQGARRRSLWVRLGMRRPAFRLAVVTMVVLSCGLGYYQYQTSSREKMALSLAAMADAMSISAEATPIPPVEMLRDFDAIYRLGQTRPQADEELLAALAMK